MKRINFLAVLAVCIPFVMALLSFGANNGKRTYNSSMPGEMYFQIWSNSYSATVVWTNSETETWYPSRITVNYPAPVAATATLSKITIIALPQIAVDTVTTNEAGIVTTNHFHGAITNTLYRYLTNLVCAVTNTATANATSILLPKDYYFQKDDLLQWTFSDTNNIWFEVIGYR